MDIQPKTSGKFREGLFEDFWKLDEIEERQDHYVNRWNLLPNIGAGSFESRSLKPGLDLNVINYRLHEPIAIRSTCPEAFEFIFMFSGLIRNKLNGRKNEFVTRGGQSELAFYPHHDGLWEEPENNQTLGISLFIKPDLLQSLIQEDSSWMSACYQNEGRLKYHMDSVLPSMLVTLHQILNCPYVGLTRRLYLEGKAIELIAQKMGQMETHNRKCPEKSTLQPNDRVSTNFNRIKNNVS